MENTLEAEVKTKIVKWTRRQIFETLQNMDETTGHQQIVTLASKLLDKTEDSFSIDQPSERSLKKVIQTIKSKWQRSCRIKERFLDQNRDWLDDYSIVTIILPEKKSNPSGSEDDSDDSRSSLGRPETPFADSSDRSKRRKTQDLRKNYSTDELTFAAKMNLRSEGATEAANLSRNHADQDKHIESFHLTDVTKVKTKTRTKNDDTKMVKQVIYMLVAVVVLFAICWGPLLIDNVLTAYNFLPKQRTGHLKYMATTFHLMAYFNSCINPIIYGFMSKSFRESFQSALCCTNNRASGHTNGTRVMSSFRQISRAGSQTRTTSIR